MEEATAAGAAGEAAVAAGAIGKVAAAATGCSTTGATLGPPIAGASGGGASTLTGAGGRSLGRNRSPPLVLTMFPAKEGKKNLGN